MKINQLFSICAILFAFTSQADNVVSSKKSRLLGWNSQRQMTQQPFRFFTSKKEKQDAKNNVEVNDYLKPAAFIDKSKIVNESADILHDLSLLFSNKNLVIESNGQTTDRRKKNRKVNVIMSREKYTRTQSKSIVKRSYRNVMSCFETGSCQNNINQDIPVCYCDSYCRVLNDCCYDHYDTDAAIDSDNLKSDLKLNFTSCNYIIPDHLNGKRGYLFVSMCPENDTRTEIQLKCEEERLITDVPVTGNDGITYKNEYCAACHGVKDYLRWNPSYDFHCEVTLLDLLNITYADDIFKLFKKKNCRLNFFPSMTMSRPRVCWKTSIPYDLDNVINKTMCLRYQHPMYFPFGEYKDWIKNGFCLPAAVDDDTEAYCALPTNVTFIKLSMHSMSALFDINGDSETDGNRKQCMESNKGNCGFHAVIANGGLEMKFKVLTNATVDVSFRILGMAYSVLKLIVPWKLKTELRGLIFYQQVKAEDISKRNTFPCSNSMTCYIIDLRIYIFVDGIISFNDISQFNSQLKEMAWLYIELDRQEPLRHTLSTISFNPDVSSIDDSVNTFQYMNEQLDRFLDVLNRQILTKKLHIPGVPKHLKVTVIHGLNDCNMGGHIDNYKISSISFASFKIVDKSVVKKTDNRHFNWIYIHTISTYTTMELSGVLLLVTIVIHKYLKLSNSIAGKVSEHLMISMFFSHIIFMFGFGANDYQIVCFIIGVLSHYVWLCCFAWMTMYTVTLLKAMIKLKQNPNLQGTKRFPLYNYVIGYGLPLLIVIPSFILDLCTRIRIGYAGKTCFPSYYPYNIVVFIAPVSVSIVINVVVLIAAGCRIYAFQKSIDDHCSALESRSYFFVYLKLFIFSGLSWSLGIVAEATDQDILRMLFIIFGGFHGVMYSVSILLSKQVRSRLRILRQKSGNTTVTTACD